MQLDEGYGAESHVRPVLFMDFMYWGALRGRVEFNECLIFILFVDGKSCSACSFHGFPVPRISKTKISCSLVSLQNSTFGGGFQRFIYIGFFRILEAKKVTLQYRVL